MSADLSAWCLVLPVKRLSVAKTRLATLAGPLRGDLALAFALDTAQAALSCRLVRGLVVVTDEPVAADALSALGAHVVADEPDAGLNSALLHGAAAAAAEHPDVGVGALSADLPALRPAELGLALSRAAGPRPCFLRDAEGSGTTLLVAPRLEGFDPAFGPRSAARHAATGARELDPAGLDSVRRDVDTAADLADAARLGLGPRTGAVVARLPRPPYGPADG